jgi:DNA-3-methyladenine glycosylase I
MTEVKRCAWIADEPMLRYHDEEWGVPVHDDRLLFEHLMLDGFQAGLSWRTILNKRENFRRAFDGFQPEKIARYNKRKVERLLGDSGIVRNRQKIAATIGNARAYLELQQEVGSFATFLWQFVGGETKQNAWKTLKQLPASTRESDAMSKALKECGFKFVGSTICYAFMQAAGLVNDHIVSCFRYAELGGTGKSRRR